MMLDATARLISVTYSGNLGTMTRSEEETGIFCQIGSVNRTEYYAAYNSGFKPEYRVTTDPVNYSGQGIIDLDLAEGPVRCDIYRTYRKSMDVLELWCVRKNEAAELPFTLWTGDKRVVLFGAYLAGSDATERTETGKIAVDSVTLVLPQTLQAYCGTTPVSYCRPKAYALLATVDKATHFTIDSSSFFALGDITPAAGSKYQDINASYDDVYRVQAVARRNTGKPDTEYLEVTGK